MSNIVAKKLAKKIIRLRKERGMSQEELAFIAGLDRTYVGRIENLKRNPTFKYSGKNRHSIRYGRI